jgi:hypothetical protein
MNPSERQECLRHLSTSTRNEWATSYSSLVRCLTTRRDSWSVLEMRLFVSDLQTPSLIASL